MAGEELQGSCGVAGALHLSAHRQDERRRQMPASNFFSSAKPTGLDEVMVESR